MVRDAHLAEDVSQGVFIALAQNASQLTDRATISGWLHRTTQNLAANAVRADVRRRAREEEAAVMNNLPGTDNTAWENIAPNLDAAIGELSDADREALLLRYFERKSADEMAQTLGISNEAAQKRVSRAVERLRVFLAEGGVAVGASGIVVALSANAVQAAPLALASTIMTVAAMGSTTLSTLSTATAAKTIAMTTLQKIVIAAALTAAVGTGLYEKRKASLLRDEVQTLRQEQTPLKEQVALLKDENDRLSNLAARAQEPRSSTLPPAQLNELLKLRGKTALTDKDARELARMKSSLGDFLTNAIGGGFSTADKWKQKDALSRLARMKKALQLTDAQEQSIKDIMMNHIQLQSQLTLDALSGKFTAEEQREKAAIAENQETEIKAVLTSGQLAGFSEYQENEKLIAADNSARSDVSQVAGKFNLSKEQQETLRGLFYDMHLDKGIGAATQDAIKTAVRAGNVAEAGNLSVELQKAQLEQKLKILEGFLLPEQLTTYRHDETKMINRMAAAMKLFSLQRPPDAAD